MLGFREDSLKHLMIGLMRIVSSKIPGLVVELDHFPQIYQVKIKNNTSLEKNPGFLPHENSYLGGEKKRVLNLVFWKSIVRDQNHIEGSIN